MSNSGMTEEARDIALKVSLVGVGGATLSWMESNGVRMRFVILDSWSDLSQVQDNLNRHLNKGVWERWRQVYVDQSKSPSSAAYCLGRMPPFAELRRGTVNGVPCAGPINASDAPYTVPDGLCELEAVSRWGFSDEYATCDRCMRMVRTSPDSWSWQPDWAYIDDDRLCSACLRAEPEAYLAYVRNAQNLLNESIIKPGDHGYARVGIRFEHGLHQGQAADPIRIGSLLGEAGIDFLFTGVPGQFYVQFWVWVPAVDLVRATQLLEKGGTDLDYDPGTEMAKALRGEATPYYKVQTRTLSAEEFIAGNWKE